MYELGIIGADDQTRATSRRRSKTGTRGSRPESSYGDEAGVRWLARAGAGERRIIRTGAELGAAIDDSASPRSIYLYIHENLLDEARSRWEDTRRSRGRALYRPDRPPDTKE